MSAASGERVQLLVVRTTTLKNTQTGSGHGLNFINTSSRSMNCSECRAQVAVSPIVFQMQDRGISVNHRDWGDAVPSTPEEIIDRRKRPIEFTLHCEVCRPTPLPKKYAPPGT